MPLELRIFFDLLMEFTFEHRLILVRVIIYITSLYQILLFSRLLRL